MAAFLDSQGLYLAGIAAGYLAGRLCARGRPIAGFLVFAGSLLLVLGMLAWKLATLD